MSTIEVNGLGVLDIVDPYLHALPQYSVGLTYERAWSPQWSLVTGASYATRGFSAREDVAVNLFGLDLPFGARLNTRLDYVEIPVQVKYSFSTSGVTPYIKAGMSAGYALQGKIHPRVDAIISWSLPAININLENDLYNRWDVAALAGAGVQIPTNDIGALLLEVNYRHSLNDLFLDRLTDVRIKTHGWSAGIGYTIRF